MSDLGRSCMMCKHFHIDMGSPGYSELTPGTPADVSCSKSEQRAFDDYGAEAFRKWIRFGNTCQRFEAAE